MQNNNTTIALDCWFVCQPNLRGIGNVNSDLISRIVNHQEFNFLLFCPTKNEFILEIEKHENCKIILTSKNYLLHEQLLLPYFCYYYGVNFLYSLANTSPVFLPKNIKRLLILHDLIFCEEKLINLLWRRDLGSLYRRVNFNVMKRLENITFVTPSDYVKGQVLRWAPCGNVKRIYNGVSKQNYDQDLLNPEMTLIQNFAFTLGALDERKNTKAVVDAFLTAKLHLYDKSLIVAGLQNIELFCKRYSFCVEELKTKNIHLFGYISKDELNYLYNKCKVFVYVSKNEGFGLPIIEAKLQGASCIVSDTTSCKEICGPSSLRINPVDDAAISNALTQAMLYRTHNKDAEADWLKKFDWSQTLKEHLGLFQNDD